MYSGGILHHLMDPIFGIGGPKWSNFSNWRRPEYNKEQDYYCFQWRARLLRGSVINFQRQSWTQILKDATQRFDDGAFDDPIDELARLKYGSSLVDYLENFDNMFSRVMVLKKLL